MFEIINNLYTQKSHVWINSLEDKDIEPFVLNMFLGMNKDIARQSRILNSYVFYLSKKQWLFLAWSLLPKSSRAPFVPYIKKNKDVDSMSVFWSKLQRMLKISDNDMPTIKKYVERDVNNNKKEWFLRLGMSKNEWLSNGLDYQGHVETIISSKKSGLEQFGF